MIPPSVQEKSLPLCNPVEHMSTNEKEKETLASLVTKLTPINVKPQGRGGWQADPGEFDIFTRARVKFPTPGHLQNVKFPSQGTAFCPKQVVAMSNSRPQGRTWMSKSPPWEKLAESTSCGFIHSPSLGESMNTHNIIPKFVIEMKSNGMKKLWSRAIYCWPKLDQIPCVCFCGPAKSFPKLNNYTLPRGKKKYQHCTPPPGKQMIGA